MKGVERPITYFEQAGYENTSDVVEIVSNRLKEGDIKNVVVASSRGETGLKFAKKDGLRDKPCGRELPSRILHTRRLIFQPRDSQRIRIDGLQGREAKPHPFWFGTFHQ